MFCIDSWVSNLRNLNKNKPGPFVKLWPPCFGREPVSHSEINRLESLDWIRGIGCTVLTTPGSNYITRQARNQITWIYESGITKCDSYFITSTTSVITKRQVLLQSATGITKCDVITKCDGTIDKLKFESFLCWCTAVTTRNAACIDIPNLVPSLFHLCRKVKEPGSAAWFCLTSVTSLGRLLRLKVTRPQSADTRLSTSSAWTRFQLSTKG